MRSLSCIESHYQYRITIITDRLLIIGKGRGGFIPTSDKGKQEHAGFEVDKQMMSQMGVIKYILGLWEKETEIRIIIFLF